MKVAVLGANGFLGKFITQYLIGKSYNVITITRLDLDLISTNAVRQWLEANSPDIIINCATAKNIGVDDKIYDDLLNNLGIFLNFYNNSKYFNKFISVGSGAEFDRTKDINCANEVDIFSSCPTDSYGYSKNVISRLSSENPKFYVLRLFGCFHPTEYEFRLFNRIFHGESVQIIDKQFDYFSAQDFCTVLNYCLNNETPYRDINCVYEQKLYLSEIFKDMPNVKILGTSSLNYTGNGSRLASLNLNLMGLEKSIKEYK